MRLIKVNSFLLILFLTSFLPLSGKSKISINEGWFFIKQDTLPELILSLPDNSWELVNLPHTWNTTDLEDDNYKYSQRICWYKKKLRLGKISTSESYSILFEGINQEADVYLNGKFITRHLGGYTAFIVPIDPFIKPELEEQILTVKVNNKTNHIIPPSEIGLFPIFGGIYRDVFLQRKNLIQFDGTETGSNGVYISTSQVSHDGANVTVKVNVRNLNGNKKSILLRNTIYDAAFNKSNVTSQKINLKPKEIKEVTVSFPRLKSIRLWSPEDPYLYKLVSSLEDVKTGSIYEETSNPIGFRYFRFSPDSGFFLNGKPYKLMGASRHQDYKGIGNALPDELHRRDVKLLKDMGANFVRLAHYPQDNSVLEECNKLGLIVWEEIPIVVQISTSEDFGKTASKMLREMIMQHYNHPSIFIWGYMNEILTHVGRKKNIDTVLYTKKTLELAKTLEKLIRDEDKGRVTAMALEYHPVYNRSGIAEIPMVVGWNLYFGWYYDQFSGLESFLDEEHKKYPKRCLILSEFGAGSDARIHSFAPQMVDHSIEWQQDLIEYHLNIIKKKPYIAGGLIWNLVDFHHVTSWATPQRNSKGILDMERNPKDIYYLFQSHQLESPVIKIASTDFTLRAGQADQGKVSNQPVKVYSNQDSVCLYNNLKLIGCHKISDYTTTFMVPFSDGSNLLEAKSPISKVSDQLNINFTLYPKNLKSAPIQGIAVNLGSNCYYVNEKKGMVWMPDKKYEPGSFGYLGGKYFYRNKTWIGWDGDLFNTDQDALFHTCIDSITGYRFDLAPGEYEAELLFAEPSWDKNFTRVFDILVNGELLIKDFEIKKAAESPWNPIVKKFRFFSKGDNVNFEFIPVKGKPLLSGITLRRM